MAQNRIFYLLALGGVTIFWAFYEGWFAGRLLLFLLLLPVASLLLTLPALLGMRLCLTLPEQAQRGESIVPVLSFTCAWPLPVGRLRLRLTGKNLLTGEEVVHRTVRLYGIRNQDVSLLTCRGAHCGCIHWVADRVRATDLLGIFSLPLRRPGESWTAIWPVATPPVPAPELPPKAAGGKRLRPLPPGSFAEEHEVRSYRPGDPMNSVHWKLSAKVDALVVREPLEPERPQLVLELAWGGAPEMLDTALDQLLWLSGALCRCGCPHRVRYLDAAGAVSAAAIAHEGDLDTLVRHLLAAPAPEIQRRAPAAKADWSFSIPAQGGVSP